MSRKTIYFPHSYLFAILLLTLIVAVGLIFVGVIGAAFSDVGFSPAITVLVLVATFAGSLVNIPLVFCLVQTFGCVCLRFSWISNFSARYGADYNLL